MPFIPLIKQEPMNVGTFEQPEWKLVPKVYFYKGTNQCFCKTCRAAAVNNPKYKKEFARHGSAYCEKHASRYKKGLSRKQVAE